MALYNPLTLWLQCILNQIINSRQCQEVDASAVSENHGIVRVETQTGGSGLSGEECRIPDGLPDRATDGDLERALDLTRQQTIGDLSSGRGLPRPAVITGEAGGQPERIQFEVMQPRVRAACSSSGGLRSFNVCRTMLQMFYHSVVSSVIFYAVVCWGSRLKTADLTLTDSTSSSGELDLSWRVELESVAEVSERRILRKLLTMCRFMLLLTLKERASYLSKLKKSIDCLEVEFRGSVWTPCSPGLLRLQKQELKQSIISSPSVSVPWLLHSSTGQ
ncbi:hypothetical protein L3Q82_000520 [Scortum barcoo]|uniref:Uncharacterized protein n=1 Tax=Scortum barcoo TaxID=214431 RepID=A0ACB8WEK8_9TELE|nr:hypothetical protein L3Q82_000520 [Scortum barcoo]